MDNPEEMVTRSEPICLKLPELTRTNMSILVIAEKVSIDTAMEVQFKVPNVGQAIFINQLCPDVDFERRMETLQRQRKETYAIRELWKSLQQRRVQKSRDHSFSDGGHNSKSTNEQIRRSRVFKTNIGSGPFIEQSTWNRQQEETNRGSLTDRGDYSSGGRHPIAGGYWESSGKFGKLSARETGSAPSRLRRSVRDEDIPYHTAITMPPDRSKSCVGFNALNQKLMCGLPNVYDRGYRPPGYTKSDIREWKNEIRKIVPKRPTLFLPAHTPLRPLTTLILPELDRPSDTSVMFRSTVDRTYGRHIEYIVDPEWFSEKITPESVKNRAHCVYTWNV